MPAINCDTTTNGYGLIAGGPLSLSMPLQTGVIRTAASRGYFDNLLQTATRSVKRFAGRFGPKREALSIS